MRDPAIFPAPKAHWNSFSKSAKIYGIASASNKPKPNPNPKPNLNPNPNPTKPSKTKDTKTS